VTSQAANRNVRYPTGVCQDCGKIAPIQALGRCQRCYALSDAPAVCTKCGTDIRPAVPGRLHLCGHCHQARPERVHIWMSRRLESLPAQLADWLVPLADELAGLGHWSSVNRHLLRIDRAASTHDVTTPKAVLAALRTTDSARATAVLTAEFLARQGLVPNDTAARLLAWRQSHRRRVPDPLRPAVDGYIDDLITQQRRAVLYGNPGLSDRTINNHLLFAVQLAHHVTAHGITHWASVSASDIDTFLTANVSARLATARGFFAYARRRKLVLINPTSEVRRRQPTGYRGRLLTLDEQRELLRRWTSDGTDPRERVVGLLCLIHAASNTEVRHLKVTHINLDHDQIRLGRRLHPAPLDPLSADAIRACLAHRQQIDTNNPHLLITHHNRLHDQRPCSVSYPNTLTRRSGVTTQTLRQTRLADLAHRYDPRVVADMIGITKDAALHYLAGNLHHQTHTFHAQTRPD
jgi:site-specific recombinase XerC